MKSNIKSQTNIWNKISENCSEVKKKDIILQNNLFIKNNKNKLKAKYFILTNNFLIYTKNDMYIKYIDLEVIRIKFNINRLNIDLNNSHSYFKLYFKDVNLFLNWKNKWEKICIQNNFEKEFKIIKAIGKEESSSIFKALKVSNKKFYLVKYLRKKENSVDDILNEIKIMRKLGSHKNIIELEGVYENKNSFFLIMEYIKYDNLKNYLNNKQNINKEILIKSIWNGINHMHKNNIIHRDLKADNIFISDIDNKNIVVKIGNFGISLDISENKYFIKQGTIGYLDPQILSNKINKFNYCNKNDIYPLGILIYYIYYQREIFDYKNIKELEEKNKNNSYYLIKEFKELEYNLQYIIKSCLEIDIDKRISIDKILAYLK